MRKNILKNIIMLYGLTAAKLIFPFLTLPYLTRVLTLEEYGIVAYVKTIMGYMQIIVDFGFMLSGTKDIVEAKEDLSKLGEVVGDVLCARILLCIGAFIALLILVFALPILHSNIVFTLLSFVTVILSIFLFDYLFQGLQKMEIITGRFVAAKAISTFLTFMLVHSGKDMLWIPSLDIIGSLVAVMFVFFEIKKLNIVVRFGKIGEAINQLRVSATYFISNAATTIYSSLVTIMIGIWLVPADIAYWSICIQIVSAIQCMYTPINDGVYPDMVKTKDIQLIKNLLKIFMPLVTVGCIALFFLSKFVLGVVGGGKYVPASWLLQMLIPVLFISFPGMLLGWPTLGAIDKPKQVMTTTVASGAFQLVFMVSLFVTGSFDLFHIAILRCATEFVLFAGRLLYCVRFRSEFSR